MSSKNTDNDHAIRSHIRERAAQKFNEVVRQNTTNWDDPPMTDDQRAFANAEILKATQEFHESTRDDYNWPSR